MASRACGANRNAGGPDPDRQALGPGAGSRCGSGSTAGSRLRGSASENRHGGAPREVPVAPGQGGRASQARPRKECACRRSIHPSSGGRNCCCRDGRWRQSPWARRRTRKRRHMRRDGQTRAQQRAAGTNNTALFDIVNRTTANGSLSRAAMSHASCARLLSCPGRAQRDPGPRSDTADRCSRP